MKKRDMLKDPQERSLHPEPSDDTAGKKDLSD